MTLTSKNYVFEGESEGTTEVSDVFATDDANRFTITKAAAPTMQPIELTVINGLAKTYLLNLPALPTLGDNCKYGSIEYEACNFDLIGEGGYANSTATITSNDEFQLTVPAVESQTEGSVGTVGVKITTDNYQDMLLPVEVIAKNKIVPVLDGEITATPITYGDTLSKSEISGKMKDPNTGAKVEGTFSWQQPDNTILDASTLGHSVEWTFTPDSEEYATVTDTATVEVAPKSIEGAVITLESADLEYNAAEQSPKITGVALKKWTENITYRIVSGNTATNVNDSLTLTIEGTGNYTGKAAVKWKFSPREVTPAIEVASCTYTGDALEPTVTLKDGNEVIPTDEYTVEYSNTTTAGTGRVTIKDVAGGNYVIKEITQDFTITKAAAPTNIQSGTLTITNGLHKTYSFDLSTLLPKLTAPCDNGTITYDKKVVTDLGTGSFITLVNGKTGELTLEANRSGTDEGQFGTITVTISTSNYQDITLTINVSAENKITPQADGAVTATDITHGQTLNDSKLAGKVKDGDKMVNGTFAWVDGTGAVSYRIDTANSTGEATIDPNTGVLTPVKVGSVSVIATKAGDNDYNDVTSAPFVLMIKPATPTGEPNYTKITTSGKTLKDAALTTKGSTLNPSDGKLEWVDDKGEPLPDDTTVKANTTYKWRFTPDDDNYTTLTGEVELYHKSSSGGGWYDSYYTIKATAGAGGSISPSGSVSVREGRDQTFTITPDKGYAVSNVKIDGKSIGAVKSYTFENVSRTHTIEVIFMKANGNPQTGVFVDVATGSYYEDAVDWAVENGITQGTDDTHFVPDGICTRAQAVTFLWRAAGSPEPETRTMPFTDIPVGSYYYDAVLWAVENGIAKGTSDTTFSPNMTCSRAQIVTFLWRSEKSPAAGTANPFADVKSTAYYADAVLWAVKENIAKGTTNTTFSPDADCTRAQIVTFLWRCKK